MTNMFGRVVVFSLLYRILPFRMYRFSFFLSRSLALFRNVFSLVVFLFSLEFSHEPAMRTSETPIEKLVSTSSSSFFLLHLK